jgi:hypothetical protein
MRYHKGTLERVRHFVLNGKTIVFIKLENDSNEYGIVNYNEREMFQLALAAPGDEVTFSEFSGYLPYRYCEDFANTSLKTASVPND